MAEAEVGDDMVGEDPTTNRLETRCAELLGKEVALFVPSGTMANQIAIMIQTRPGDEIIANERSHCIHNESGGLGANCGVQHRPLSTEHGFIRPEHLEGMVRGRDLHHPRTTLVCLENTHNFAGGTVYPPELITATARRAHELGLAVHMDGARLWNASVACGVPPAELARECDTVCFCFSKGLGAPVGSILAGSKELMAEARRARKRLGGAMRQVGVLAAAALYALEHNIERLAEDHERARLLAAGVGELPRVTVEPAKIETNIVMIDLLPDAPPASTVVARLAEHGVLLFDIGPRRLRAVTHLEITTPDIEKAVGAFADAVA